MTSNCKDLTIGNLAKKIDIPQTHPYFYEVLGILMDLQAIVIYNIIGNIKLIRINHKRMKKILEESEVYEQFQEFIHNKTDFYLGV